MVPSFEERCLLAGMQMVLLLLCRKLVHWYLLFCIHKLDLDFAALRVEGVPASCFSGATGARRLVCRTRYCVCIAVIPVHLRAVTDVAPAVAQSS